jgi:Protein of unknown function (DUF1553)/Protein of unknown function (DUF1549)/Bacterial Ig-like domain (group 2)
MRFVSLLILLLGATAARAAELAIYPTAVTLTGPSAKQQLRLCEVVGARATADVTDQSAWSSDNAKIVSVSKSGEVQSVGAGKATISATVAGQTKSITIMVVDFDKPRALAFVPDIQPVLTKSGCNMGACHGALAGKGGFKLSLRGYNHESDHFTIAKQALARRTDTTEPDESLILKKATRSMSHAGGKRFAKDSEEYRVLREWIAAGAPGPADNDVSLAKIEVFPNLAVLKPKDNLKVVVQATYSDGRTADVTHWAKFSSSEETIVTVDDEGQAKVEASGEAAIAVLFGSKVATATITVPHLKQVDAALFDKAGKNNFIDEHVLNKLKLLNLPPSGDCTDAEFIRRATLDTCGLLPTPDEVKAFVADAKLNKRERLIDSLLARTEFTDYWTHKWCDLFLVSTRKLSQQSMLGFHRQIRSAVADNLGWDQVARDILTANGSTLAKGGGAYFVQRKDVTDLTESTAVTFLGMSITCARCHNHPLEKWTQDQYWQLANLFSRVNIKNGDRSGEQWVQSAPTGDALHLRTGKPMPPTPLDGVPMDLDSSADRREYFANWLTSPKNPYFAKAIVNRIWRNYLGRGLVEAEDDLRDTNPATNKELLDALTADFVANKFDTKRLMKLILNSATYQRSSKATPQNIADDRFYSRYLLRRLPAEVLLDAYSDITGVPTPFNTVALGVTGGTAKSELYGEGTRAMQLPDSLLVSQFLDSFGRAERSLACSCETTTDSSVGQALHLNNGKTLNDKLRDPKSIVNRWLDKKTSDADIVTELFRRTLGREANATERKKFESLLAEASKTGAEARREALEDAVWAVLTSKEFLFNH